MSAEHWRVEFCADRHLLRYRVVAMDRPGVPTIETFLTRRAAKRFIRKNTWKADR